LPRDTLRISRYAPLPTRSVSIFVLVETQRDSFHLFSYITTDLARDRSRSLLYRLGPTRGTRPSRLEASSGSATPVRWTRRVFPTLEAALRRRRAFFLRQRMAHSISPMLGELSSSHLLVESTSKLTIFPRSQVLRYDQAREPILLTRFEDLGMDIARVNSPSSTVYLCSDPLFALACRSVHPSESSLIYEAPVSPSPDPPRSRICFVQRRPPAHVVLHNLDTDRQAGLLDRSLLPQASVRRPRHLFGVYARDRSSRRAHVQTGQSQDGGR
jgi:hypothetical protein